MNEEEKLLRDYLFHFLRSEDYKTDVNFYLPKFLANDPAFAETQRTLSWEHEQYRLKVIDFAKQLHPQTATWGLNIWEEELGLPTDLSVDIELRRAKVMAKLLGSSPMTVENTNKLVNLFTDDGKAYVEELPEDGVIKVVIPSQDVHLDEMRDSLDEMLPAHLAYNFQHIIHIGDDDSDDADDDSKPDKVDDINDESTVGIDGSAFFIHADFPITENIPYGITGNTPEYNVIKYDGEVQAKAPNEFDGLIYNGEHSYNGVPSSSEKFQPPRQWWFIPAGESTFNNEFQSNGAIKYDGLKPQEIEYDNGMDELDSTTISPIFEDSISDVLNYDGKSLFDGNTLAGENQTPADSSGNLEITRYRRFDGIVNYDGGDINYFDGTLRANGLFDFTGQGFKATVEQINDRLDGEFSITKPSKEVVPLSYYNPEIYDFVQRTLETYSAEISTSAVEDSIADSYDDCNAMSISKAIRYNGTKNYDGGRINYFNGALKADGKFNFEGEGNRAKFEIIALDVGNTFSLTRIEQGTPIPYIEQFDFVNLTYDENAISAQINVEDTVSSKDCSGDLVIRQRLRYNGKFKHRGNFEHHNLTTKQFNGHLNYNSVLVIKSNGKIQFNGQELYGSRKNTGFFEWVDDLDGDFEIRPDASNIPIATRDKLGYVIVGKNLSVDSTGKISLIRNATMNGLKEIEAGTIPNLFNVWRGLHEI